MPEGLSREEAVEILAGGYGEQLLQSAAHYVAPIFWGDPSSDESGSIENNGSIFFLECGGPEFAVTCDHVIENWIGAKRENPSLRCQLMDLPFDPESRIIDRDPNLDLATLEISEGEVQSLDKWIYRRAQDRWPPDPPEEGKGVFFAGFPGIYRSILDDGSIEFGIYTGLGVATSVSEEKIVYQYEREHFVDVLGHGIPPEHEWLGGLSGAPLWTVTSFGWRLAGVIYQWSTDYEFLYARRAHFIQPDGQIRR